MVCIGAMNIMLGNSVRLPLGREPQFEATIPVQFTEAPSLMISLSPPPSADGPAAPKAAGPLLPRTPVEAAFEEPFDQFDDLLTPLGSSALSDWPL